MGRPAHGRWLAASLALLLCGAAAGWGSRAALAAGPEPLERVVVLGDSLSTAGAGPSGLGHPCWWEFLADELAGRAVVLSVAVPGSRIARSWPEQLARALELDPDRLVVMWGTNDAIHAAGPEAIGTAAQGLVDAARAAGVSIAFVEPPAIYGWGGLTPERAAVASRALAETAWPSGAPLVPTSDLWSLEAYLPEVVGDGVHIDGDGHWALARRVGATLWTH